MTKNSIPTPVESKEYDFVLINGLREENTKMKEAINDILDILIDSTASRYIDGVPSGVWIKNRLLETVK